MTASADGDEAVRCVARLWFGEDLERRVDEFASCKGTVGECLLKACGGAEGWAKRIVECGAKGAWDAGEFLACVSK